MHVFFALLILFASNSSFASSCEDIYELRKDSYSAVKNDALYIQKAALTSDIKTTCEELITRDAPESVTAYNKKKNGQALTTKEKETLSKSRANPWRLSIPKNIESRKAAFDITITAMRKWGISSRKELDDILNGTKAPPTPTNRGSRLLTSIRKSETSGKQPISKVVENTKQIGLFSATVACSEISILDSVSCGKGLQKAVSWMKADFISLPDVYARILTDKKFEAGIVQAAQKIMAKADSEKPGNTHLFDDLYESFKSTGSSDKEAQKNAWDAIGVISSAGPNLISRLNYLRDPTHSDKTMIALSAISVTTPLLDLQTENNESGMYSYPNGMKFNCDNGKNYHFWMSAYLAHRLVDEEGLTPSEAAMAAYTAEKGYQMLATTVGPRDADAIFKLDTFNSRLLSMRNDLVQGSAGALYGAKGQINDIDKGFARMIDSADPPVISPNPKLNWKDTPLSAYTYFNKVMAPDSVISDWLEK
jgi:hypothetical protein